MKDFRLKLTPSIYFSMLHIVNVLIQILNAEIANNRLKLRDLNGNFLFTKKLREGK